MPIAKKAVAYQNDSVAVSPFIGEASDFNFRFFRIALSSDDLAVLYCSRITNSSVSEFTYLF